MTTRMRTSSAAERRQVDRPPAVRRRVTRRGSTRPSDRRSLLEVGSGSGETVDRVGLDGDRSERTVPRATPSTHSRRGRSNVHARRVIRRLCSCGWGTWVPVGSRRHACQRARRPTSSASTSTTSARPSFGWARGATSHAPDVGRRSSRATTGPRHHDRRATTWATRDDRRADRPRPATRRPGTRGHRRSLAARTERCRTGRRRTDAAAVARLDAGLDRVGSRRRRRRPASAGRAVGLAPRPRPGRIVIARRSPRRPTLSATTPRNAAAATCAAASRVGARPAPRRPPGGQVDQLLHRAHEVAAGQLLVPDDLGEALARPPRRRRRRRTRDRAGGARRRPPARSSAARSSLIAAIRRQRSRTSRRREPRRRRRLRAAVLVHEHRQQPGQRRPRRARRTAAGAGTRRPAGRTRGTCRRQRLAARRSASTPSSVDVPAPVQDVEHAVELAGERLAVAVDPAGEVVELALQALGLAGGPHPLAQVGIGLDRVVRRRRTTAAPRRPARVARRSVGPLSARATSRAVLGPVRAERVGSRTRPIDAAGTSSKSSARQQQQARPAVVTVVRRIPPLRWALATHGDRPP